MFLELVFESNVSVKFKIRPGIWQHYCGYNYFESSATYRAYSHHPTLLETSTGYMKTLINNNE